jgi:hypothetical protein
MSVSNTLAYYDTAIMTLKSFIVQAPRACIINLLNGDDY